LDWWADGPKILSLQLAGTGVSWLPVALVRWIAAALTILFFCAVLAPQFRALRNPQVLLGTGTLLVPILFHAALDLIMIPLLRLGSGEHAA
jgi:hypothetical protein